MTETLRIQLALSGLQSVQSGLQSIGTTVRTTLSAVAAITAAVASSRVAQEFTRINDEMVKVGNTATTFGLSARFVSEFGYAFRVAGVEQTKFAEGMKGFLERATSQGRVVTDLTESILDQADVFAAMPDGAHKAQLAVQMFGEAGLHLIPVLNRGREGIKTLAAEARMMGVSINDEAVRSARDLRQHMERLDGAMEGVKTRIVSNLTPAFGELSKTMGAMFSKDGKGPLERFATWTSEMSENVGRNVVFSAEKIRATFASLWSGDTALDAIEKGWVSASNAMVRYEQGLAKLKTVSDGVPKPKDFGPAYGPDIVEGLNSTTRLNTISGRMPGLGGLTDTQARDTERQRAQNRIRALEAQVTRVQSDNAGIESAQMWTDTTTGQLKATDALIAYREQISGLRDQIEQTKETLGDLGASETRFVWQQTLLDLQNQWGSWSAQIAAGFAQTFNTAISSIGSNLTAVIMQTRSWGQALANIGNTILTTVIQSIVEMGVRWVLTRAVVGLANIAWSGKEAAAAAPFGLIQSISSFGVAALVGGAAFAGIMAAVGGFAQGGYTGNIGTSTPAGIVHGREFVMSAPATAAIGVDALNAMNETGGIPASGRESRIVIVDDARSASDLANDPNFETVVVNLAAANAWRIRG